MGDTRMETYYGFVSTSEDALALFEACRLGYKQRVPRRLSDAERAAIRSGSVFVWEESESGMKRWTDGRSWSPSRVQGCFLTYHEWEGRRRAQRHPSFHTMHSFNLPANIHGLPGQPIPMGIARYGHFIGGPTKAGSTQVQYGFPKENGMLKKALSIRTTDGKKLHIIAYYSKEDHAQRRLLTPTTDPIFPKLVVPPNLYPDMSPESMYGSSHSLASPGASASAAAATATAGAFGNASASPADCVPQSSPTSLLHEAGQQSPTGLNPRESAKAGSRYLQRLPAVEHVRPVTLRGHAHPSLPQPRHPRTNTAGRRPSPDPTGAAASAAAVDALSVGLHKARVQSLIMDTDVPSPSSLLSPGQLLHHHEASRPALEPHHHHRYVHTHPPHSAHPMSAPSSMASNGDGRADSSSGGGSSNTRPSSNSFSGSLSYAYGGPRGMSLQHEHSSQMRRHRQGQYEASLGLSASPSSSAPASTMMRTAGADSGSYGSIAEMPLATEPHPALSIASEATLMQVPPDLPHRRGMGIDRRGIGGPGSRNDMAGGHGRKYLGLGGPLGLGPRRSTPLRSATTAAVMVHHPYAHPMSAGSRMRSSPGADPLPYGVGRSPPRTANAAIPTRLHSTSHLPLLLSPVNPPQLAQRSGSLAGGQHISLAAIRRDVREGPRRLPSISDNLRSELPHASHRAAGQPSYSPGGLGIFNAGVPPSRTSSSLLPSPLPTPRQSLAGGFDTRRESPPRCGPDSLAALVSAADRNPAADRSQHRHAVPATQQQRVASSGHHPYLRPWRRGPAMRSVSLKQSEDIRQLGVLDQSLRLK